MSDYIKRLMRKSVKVLSYIPRPSNKEDIKWYHEDKWIDSTLDENADPNTVFDYYLHQLYRINDTDDIGSNLKGLRIKSILIDQFLVKLPSLFYAYQPFIASLIDYSSSSPLFTREEKQYSLETVKNQSTLVIRAFGRFMFPFHDGFDDYNTKMADILRSFMKYMPIWLFLVYPIEYWYTLTYSVMMRQFLTQSLQFGIIVFKPRVIKGEFQAIDYASMLFPEIYQNALNELGLDDDKLPPPPPPLFTLDSKTISSTPIHLTLVRMRQLLTILTCAYKELKIVMIRKMIGDILKHYELKPGDVIKETKGGIINFQLPSDKTNVHNALSHYFHFTTTIKSIPFGQETINLISERPDIDSHIVIKKELSILKEKHNDIVALGYELKENTRDKVYEWHKKPIAIPFTKETIDVISKKTTDSKTRNSVIKKELDILNEKHSDIVALGYELKENMKDKVYEWHKTTDVTRIIDYIIDPDMMSLNLKLPPIMDPVAGSNFINVRRFHPLYLSLIQLLGYNNSYDINTVMNESKSIKSLEGVNMDQVYLLYPISDSNDLKKRLIWLVQSIIGTDMRPQSENTKLNALVKLSIIRAFQKRIADYFKYVKDGDYIRPHLRTSSFYGVDSTITMTIGDDGYQSSKLSIIQSYISLLDKSSTVTMEGVILRSLINV